MNSELTAELTQSITELAKAGWFTVKIINSLASPESYGTRATKAEITALFETLRPELEAAAKARTAEKMAKIQKQNAEAREYLDGLAEEFGSLIRGGAFNLTRGNITRRYR